MRELDKTKKYNLSFLNSDQLKELFLELAKLKGWEKVEYGLWSRESNFVERLLVYSKKQSMWHMNKVEDKKGSTNALELFYTLENIQVYCRELEKHEIISVVNVFNRNGYSTFDSKFKTNDKRYYVGVNLSKKVGFFLEDDSKKKISYNKFMELFGGKYKEKKRVTIDTNQTKVSEILTRDQIADVIDKPIQGKKESNGKCKFELDFEFIEAMSLRIENETKYEPYNWKLPLNTDELENALLRHAIEVKKGNFDDNGELGHLMAIANNAMFLYYQLKNNK